MRDATVIASAISREVIENYRCREKERQMNPRIRLHSIHDDPAALGITGFERRACPSWTRNRGSSLAMEHDGRRSNPRNTRADPFR
jgi:hypothetical protein